MSLEILHAELDTQRRNAVQKVRHDAEVATAQIESDAREKATALIANAREAASQEASRKGSEVNAAKQSGKKLLSEAQQAAVQRVFSDVRTELAAIARSQEYPAILERLTTRAVKSLGSREFVLRGRKSDGPLLAKWGKVGPALDAIGGVRVETPDGKVAMNATFDALLESHAEEVRQRAFKELFGKNANLELELPVEMAATAYMETMGDGRVTVEGRKPAQPKAKTIPKRATAKARKAKIVKKTARKR